PLSETQPTTGPARALTEWLANPHRSIGELCPPRGSCPAPPGRTLRLELLRAGLTRPSDRTSQPSERKGGAMNRHRTRILTAIAAVGALVATALLILPAQATPPSGVTTTLIGVGRFTTIDAKAKTDVNPGAPTEFW